MILVLLTSIAISFIFCRLVHDGAPVGIPRVGKAGVIGYLMMALRFATNSEKVLDEADKMFAGRPYALPTLAGWTIVLSPEHTETLRASNDSVFNQPVHLNKFLQLDHTMNGVLQEIRFHESVVRSDLTRAIADFIPTILDESTLALEEILKPPFGSEHASFPVLRTMSRMLGRISNCAIMGTEFCRNERFIDGVVRFTETLIIYARFLNWTPNIPGLRSLVCFVLTSIWGGTKQPLALIKPYVAKRLEERKVSGDHPFNIAELLLNNAPAEVAADVDDLAMRVLYLNFGSIFPVSVFLSQTLFEMAQMPAEDIDSIRKEVQEALEQEGGWNRSSLNRFFKIDSILREVGRVHGVALLGMVRLTIADGRLPDGVVIPPGYQVAVNLKHFHRDPHVYPDPYIFKPFRFSERRAKGGDATSVKDGFTTVDDHFLPFGSGRHACPGRFFASMQLKIIIAIILLNYEFKLPDGKIVRPKNFVVDGLVVPPLTEHLWFKPRAGTA